MDAEHPRDLTDKWALMSPAGGRLSLSVSAGYCCLLLDVSYILLYIETHHREVVAGFSSVTVSLHLSAELFD